MLSTFLSTIIEQASMRLALAAKADGTLDVPARANWIYARLGGAGGTEIECETGVIKPNAGDSIYVMRIHPNQSAGWRQTFWLRDGSDPALPAPVVGSVYVSAGEFLLDDDSETLLDDDSEELQA